MTNNLTPRQLEILRRIFGMPDHRITTRDLRDVHPFSITGLCGKGYLRNVGSKQVGKKKWAIFELTNEAYTALGVPYPKFLNGDKP